MKKGRKMVIGRWRMDGRKEDKGRKEGRKEDKGRKERGD